MVLLVREKAYDPFCDERLKGFNMEDLDPRNREWTVPAHEVEAREREEKKQLMKEAIKEALEESGIPLEDLMKILNKQ